MKKKTKPKKILWGVWLSNHTDRRDDEWVGVMAETETEAIENAQFDHSRFSAARALPKKEFCKLYGLMKSWLTKP